MKICMTDELTGTGHRLSDRLTGELSLFCDVLTDLGASLSAFLVNLADHSVELAIYLPKFASNGSLYALRSSHEGQCAVFINDYKLTSTAM